MKKGAQYKGEAPSIGDLFPLKRKSVEDGKVESEEALRIGKKRMSSDEPWKSNFTSKDDHKKPVFCSLMILKIKPLCSLPSFD